MYNYTLIERDECVKYFTIQKRPLDLEYVSSKSIIIERDQFIRSDDWMMQSSDWLTQSSDWMYALWDQHMRSLCRTFARRFCVTLSLWRIRLATLAGDAMTIVRVLCRGASLSGSARCLTIDYRLSIFTRTKNHRGRGYFREKNFFDLMIQFCLVTTILETFSDLKRRKTFSDLKRRSNLHPTFTGKLQNGSHPSHTTIYFFLVFFCFGVSPHIAT